MSILIRGISMPKSCYECKLDLRTDICQAFCEWNAEHPYSIRAKDRLPDCPLSEAPEQCEDAVNRETLLKFFDAWMSVLDENCHNQSVSDLKIIKRDFANLPPVTPKQRTGKWIKTARWRNVYKCDKCGNYLDFSGVNAGRGDANYCPNCGSRNEVTT